MTAARVARADRRLGETWTRAQTRKNDAIYAAATLALAVATRLGPRLRRALGRRLGDLIWLVWHKGRRRIETNLSRALPSPRLTARAVLQGLGESLADTVGLLAGDPPALAFVDVDARVLETALAEGNGVVYATAHLGPWEAMGALLRARGFSVATVARASYDPRFDRLYDRLREANGVRALYRGTPGFAVALVRALRAGFVVGFPMDLAGRGVRTVEAAWFSCPLPTPVGPAELALRTGASVVVATPTCDESGAVRLWIERVPTADHDAASLTRELARRLSLRIAALPARWPWMARDLSQLPPEAASR